MNRTVEIHRLKIVCKLFQDQFSLILRFPASNKYFISHIIACVFNALLTLSTLSLNSVTILTFWKSSQLRSKVSNFLILVQSCIDLGVGAIGSSLFTLSLLDEIRGTGNCWLRFARGYATMLLTIISMTTISAMNMERYFGVVHPFFHRDKVTRNRLLVYVILLSSLVVIFFSLSFALNGMLRYLGRGYFSLSFIDVIRLHKNLSCKYRIFKKSSCGTFTRRAKKETTISKRCQTSKNMFSYCSLLSSLSSTNWYFS